MITRTLLAFRWPALSLPALLLPALLLPVLWMALCWPSTTFGQDTSNEQSVKPGINDKFIDPDLNVEEWLARFEIESREVYSARARVLEVCDFKPGQRIADIGAGTGFYSRLFADAVGETGWIYSVDIVPKFLEHINKQARKDGITNLTCVLCTDRSTRLPPESVDGAFLCDTYHHFEFPPQTLASLYQAMKPGGKLVLIDFERIEGQSSDFIMGHVRAGKETFRTEIMQAGFEFAGEERVEGFEENYLLVFRKPTQ
ncbi:MAG: methyltransferase domain-containing protein [Planctomycetota bacterium]